MAKPTIKEIKRRFAEIEAEKVKSISLDCLESNARKNYKKKYRNN